MTTPRGQRAAGRRLWTPVTSDFELDPPGRELLAEACRTVDLIAELPAETAANGAVIDSPQWGVFACMRWSSRRGSSGSPWRNCC
jgi:hypothetical protein